MSHDQLRRPATSDTMFSEDPSIAESDRRKKTLRRVVGGITATAILATGGAFITSKAGSEAPSPDRNSTSAGKDPSGTATPEVSQTPAPVETTAPSDRETNIFNLSTLSESEHALVKRMDAMSVEDFEAAPLEQRLIYAIGKDDQVSRGLFVEYFMQPLSDGSVLAQHSYTVAPLTKDSGVAAIMAQSKYSEQLSYGWELDYESDSTQLDNDTARKMVSAFALDPKSGIYQNLAEDVTVNESAHPLSEAEMNWTKYTEGDTTPAVSPVDGSETVEKTVYSVTTDGEFEGATHEYKLVFCEMAEQLGEDNGLWLMVESDVFPAK